MSIDVYAHLVRRIQICTMNWLYTYCILYDVHCTYIVSSSYRYVVHDSVKVMYIFNKLKNTMHELGYLNNISNVYHILCKFDTRV